MLRKYILIPILFGLTMLICSCDGELKNALNMAGNNRAELEKVLEHFKNDPDPLKFESAGNYTSWCHILESGVCGIRSQKFILTYKDMIKELYGGTNGKYFIVGTKLQFTMPGIYFKLENKGKDIVETGRYNVCVISLLETCDRTKQKNCNGATDWNNNLAKFEDAID